MVAIGTGGIKPCVSALGGDQFKDNEKGQKQLAGFFTLFYASINAGSLLSTFVSPILREGECFDRSDCYFIAFIVPAALMIGKFRKFVKFLVKSLRCRKGSVNKRIRLTCFEILSTSISDL